MDLNDPNYGDLPPYLVKYRQNLDQANFLRKDRKKLAIEKGEEILSLVKDPIKVASSMNQIINKGR